MSSSSGNTEYLGEERRAGRVVYSRGPIILALEIANTVTSVLALIALALAVSLFLTRTADLKRSERYSNYKTCSLIVGILSSFHTQQGQHSAKLILTLNPELRDCHAYARIP